MATVADVLDLLKIKAAQIVDKDKQIADLNVLLTEARGKTKVAEDALAGALSPNGATEAELQSIAIAAAAIGGPPAPVIPAAVVPAGDKLPVADKLPIPPLASTPAADSAFPASGTAKAASSFTPPSSPPFSTGSGSIKSGF